MSYEDWETGESYELPKGGSMKRYKVTHFFSYKRKCDGVDEIVETGERTNDSIMAGDIDTAEIMHKAKVREQEPGLVKFHNQKTKVEEISEE